MVAKPLCPLYKNIIKPLDRVRYPELRYKYLGNDGTVVGYYGGSTTYSFKNLDLPDFPISKKVHFNKEQEQIEVNININSK